MDSSYRRLLPPESRAWWDNCSCGVNQGQPDCVCKWSRAGVLGCEVVLTQANAGDSRAITSCNGKVVALSHDHKPNLPGEECHGYVHVQVLYTVQVRRTVSTRLEGGWSSTG